jgi:glycosyltransferase involved in cell wall biosynthesis/O-antigen/teichoic acid export membrane protein
VSFRRQLGSSAPESENREHVSGSEAPELIVASILRATGGTGVQTHIREFRDYLQRENVESQLITPFSRSRYLSFLVFGMRYLIEPFSKAEGIAWYRKWHGRFLERALRRTLNELDHAVIYAHCPVAAQAALRARRHPNQRIVMAVHFDTSQADEWAVWKGLPRHGRTFRGIRKLENEILPQLDGIVYVSESGRRNLSWVRGIEMVPSAIIPNFIRTEAVSGPPVLAADLVSIGALDARKNQEFLLQVLASANRLSTTPVTLDLIGSGPDEKQLREQAKALKVDGQIRLLGFQKDAKHLLPNYRIYVHAARLEVLPLSIIEAMAAGLPVIAGEVGGIPELFDPGVEGNFWPLDDPDKAAEILITCLSNPAECKKAGEAAQHRFKERYDAAVVAPRLLEFLRSVDVVEPEYVSERESSQTFEPGESEGPGSPAHSSGDDGAASTEGGAKSKGMSVRAGVTTADQAVSSLSNFAVGVAIARIAGIAGLGAFTLMYAVWLIVASMHRALITDPMAIEGDLHKSDAKQHIRDGLSGEIALGLTTGVAFAAVGLILILLGQETFGLPFLAVSPWLPFLLAQDYWRWVGFMAAQPGKSLRNDIVFDVAQGICFAAILITGQRSSALAITAWGIGAAAGALYGLHQFSVRPAFRGGLNRLKFRWGISKWLVGTNAAGWGVSQSYIVLAGVFLGPAALGGLKAAMSLVGGPALVLIQAGGSIGLPEASRALKSDGWHGLRKVERTITFAGFLTVGTMVVVIALFGSKILELFYGDQFGKFAPAALIIAIGWCAASLGLGSILNLKATRRTNMLFRVTLIALVASVIATIVLVPLFGLNGAAFATVVTYTVATTAQLIAHHRHSKKAVADLMDPPVDQPSLDEPAGLAFELGELGADFPPDHEPEGSSDDSATLMPDSGVVL